MVATARRCSSVACAAIRLRASASVIPRPRTSRATRVASLASTTITRSYVSARRDSTSSGTSLTTTLPGPAAATSSATRARTRGCTIFSRRSRATGSAKTIRPSAGRSSAPSGPSTSDPNAATTSASPSVPGATASRASRSESITTAPSSARRAATTLLPAPMPPVSPTSIRPSNRTGTRPARSDGAHAGATWSALSAGELLPQRGERLVGGQRAAGLLGRLGGGRGARRGRRGGTGRSRLGDGVRRPGRLDLLGVRLPALAGLGVLPLPLLALLLVPIQPLAGLRVEAFGVDVVALGVVCRGHAVERRVEVLLALDEALVGLLERQRDPPALQVDVEHLDHHLLADLDHFRGMVDVLPGQLRDVHQAVDAAEVHERPEVDDRGDHALADLALLEL